LNIDPRFENMTAKQRRQIKNLCQKTYSEKYLPKFSWLPENISDVTSNHIKHVGIIEAILGERLIVDFLRLRTTYLEACKLPS